MLQPNIPNRPFFDAGANALDYSRLIEMSEALCAPGRLLLWPESAAWPRAWQDDARLRSDVTRLTCAAAAACCSTPRGRSQGRRTTLVLLVERDEDGSAVPGQVAGLRIARADKRHLVPFGEFVPFKETLPFLGKIARSIGDFSPAAGIRLLERRDRGGLGVRIGVAVCYEVVFPGETAALVPGCQSSAGLGRTGWSCATTRGGE